MGELLFNPVKVQRSSLRTLYKMLEGKSSEEQERFLIDNQISQPLAVRLGIKPEELTGELLARLERAGGTDHPDNTLHSSPIASEREGF